LRKEKILNQVVIYEYGGQEIEGVETDEGIAMSDEQIGTALGYTDPARAMARLVSRNAAELDGLSTQVNLVSTDGKTYNKRVWAERGVIRITFLAKTAKAADFRKWATEVIYAIRHNHPPIAQPEPNNAMVVACLTALQQGQAMQGQMLALLHQQQAQQAQSILALTEGLSALVQQKTTSARKAPAKVIPISSHYDPERNQWALDKNPMQQFLDRAMTTKEHVADFCGVDVAMIDAILAGEVSFINRQLSKGIYFFGYAYDYLDNAYNAYHRRQPKPKLPRKKRTVTA
jgi:prophage antirepressor-like protein